MPTLHWIGKDKVINHHMDVPFKVLEHSYGFENGTQTEQETQSGNKIIHGDNLEALKALLPEYEGKIKCIYIDPPYNTGNESWVYNDNVNDPKIKKWLGKVVGKEAEDLTRHDKWLCMMYPRLKLMHKLLADDGAIFISIDENENNYLKIICEEIFGKNNFVGEFIWKARSGKGGTTKLIANQHEYIFFIAKNIQLVKVLPDLKIGKQRKEQLRQWGQGDKREDRPSMFFPIFVDNDGNAFVTDNDLAPNSYSDFKIYLPIKTDGSEGRWRVGKSKVLELINQKSLYFSDKGNERNVYRLFEEGNITESALNSILLEYGSASTGTLEIKEIFGNKVFDTTKPLNLINYLLTLITHNNPNSIILDCFAGSGTTAHAVLNLNKQDDGNRKFICIEMMDYAENITADRVKRAIKGYGNIEGINESFDFYELGQPLFLEDGNLNEIVGVDKIRKYIYYTETKKSLTNSNSQDTIHFLDKFNDTAYYLNYELDKRTTLDHEFLATIKTKAEQYIIYADNCLLTKDFMLNHHIIFKKIPRDITRF